MDNLPFADKYGYMTYCDASQAFVRQKGYVIIKKGAAVMCRYDDECRLFALPSDDDVEISAEPTFSFIVSSYIFENSRPIKETQSYRVYDVKNADIENTPLQWCLLDDIALKKIPFDATQMVGIKNMLVRINKNEENL